MAELAKSRRGTFQKMMEELPGKGYEVVDLREEDGFMARLGIKVHEGERRGCLIICAGGGFAFKSWNEALPVAEFFYERGINVAILDYHVNRETDLRLDGPATKMAGEDGLQAVIFKSTCRKVSYPAGSYRDRWLLRRRNLKRLRGYQI